MKRTSKKLLSLLLAVVMVVTSCSVGFTAFAADESTTSTNYWKNTTEAEDAYASIESLVDQLVPTILGIEINGATIGSSLGMSEDQIKNATLNEVVTAASPMLVGALGSGDVNVKDFLIEHVDEITELNWSNKYLKYYSYLNGSADDTLSFYQLYEVLDTGKGSSDPEFAEYCTTQLEKLDALLKIASSAELAYDSKGNKNEVVSRYKLILDASDRLHKNPIIADAIRNGTTPDEIRALKVIITVDSDGNITKIQVPRTAADQKKAVPLGDYIDNDPVLIQGVALANEALNKFGTEQNLVSNPTEALLYYFSNTSGYYARSTLDNSLGYNYEQMLTYIQLAQEGKKPLTTKMIDGTDQEITIENYLDVLGEKLAVYAPDDANAAQKKYYYFPKMIYDCLYDGAGNKDVISYGNVKWDSYGSSSYDAINAALLVRNGSVESVEEAMQMFDDAKFTDSDIKEICDHATAGYPDILHDYINSSECTLTEYKKNYLNFLYKLNRSYEFSAFNVIVSRGVDEAKAYRPYYSETLRRMITVKTGEVIELSTDMKPETRGCSLFELFDSTVSGLYTKDEIVSGKTIFAINEGTDIDGYFKPSCPDEDFLEIAKFDEAIKPEISKPENQYSYEKFALPEEYMVYAANNVLDAKLSEFLSPDTQIGGMLSGILGELFETKVDLYTLDGSGVLNNLWLNLYNEPVATIFNLVPVLAALIDEVAVPMLFAAPDDAKYNNLRFLISDATTLIGQFAFENTTTDGEIANNIAVGITSTSFDLNTLLPALFTLLDENGGYEAANEIVGTYGDWVADNNLRIQNGYTDEEGNVYDENVLRITGVYAADAFLANVDFKALLSSIDSLDPQVATGLAELIQDVISVGKTATDNAYDLMNGADAEKYYRYVKEGQVDADRRISQKGLNNVALSLPIIFDSFGKAFAEKHGIDSDWTAIYDGKFDTITKTFTSSSSGNTEVEQTVNTDIQTLKNYAVNKNPAGVLTSIIDIVIGNMINGVIDLANDTLTTDNDITNNLSLVTGLLQSLGGVGPKSILTDVLNGFFDLSRKDDASFTLGENERTGFVGFSTESALFLISNISYTDGDVNKGIVPLIQGLVVGGDNQSTNSASTLSLTDNEPSLAKSVRSAANARSASSVDSETIEIADQLVSELDDLLSSLLANTKLNGFKFDSNDGILAGLMTAVSRYIGKDNASELLNLVDEYLTIFETTPSNSEVNAKEVYTNKKLNEIVTGTYTLLEKIVDYLFYNETDGLLANKDPYKVVTGAITGIVSPDSVAIRMEDGFSAIKDLEGKKTWAEVGTVDYDVKAGDKASFYKGFGQSISGIAAILSAVLTYSYTDSSKSDNLYSAVLYPELKALADHTGAAAPMTGAEFNAEDPADQIIFGVLTPVSNILSQFYDAPASFLLNVASALGEMLDDAAITTEVNNVVAIINNVFDGLLNFIGESFGAPTLAEYLADIMTFYPLEISLPSQDVVYSLISGLEIAQTLNLRPMDWAKLANAGTPGEALAIIYNYIQDTILQSDTVMNAVENVASELAKILEELNFKQLVDVLNAVISSVSSPTEIYWTFKQYAGKITNTFIYPKNITPAEAENGVDALDKLVENLFPLLNELGVTDISGLGTLVNDKLYTNDILTKAATGIYGAIQGLGNNNEDIAEFVNKYFSPDAIADYLMDTSYGQTYSSAASTLRNASSWKDVKSLNWGFKDGSGKAQQGFVNGLAAVLRPLNDILTLFLADGKAMGDGFEFYENLGDILREIEIDTVANTSAADGEFGFVLYLSMSDGVLELTIDSNNSNEDSTLTIDLATIFENYFAYWKINPFGTNGYENAVIPLLEAFMCKGVKTYDEYITDYNKAKDNLLIDILNPIATLISDVCTAPANTLTAILPNVAYFLDSNGLAQVVNNLLAPITSEKGIVGQLVAAGIDVDKVIEQIAGGPLGDVITNALGINVNLTLKISDLNSCNIQDILIPLVSKILKDKGINIKLSDISFAELASLGTITVVNSKAKNADGKYETRQVVADKGKVLIAVLRYVADVLIRNSTEIGKLVSNIDAIKKNKTLKNIIDCVFATIKGASKDDIVRAIFYLLAQTGTLGVPEDAFFDYSEFKTKESTFSFGNMDEDFCRQLAPMLDGLIGGLLTDKGGLNGLIGGMLYKDDIISSIATGLYSAIEGVKVGNLGSLTALLQKTGIDFSTANVADLLTDKAYGKTFEAAAKTIKNAGSWKNVNKASLSWGVTDRASFLNALVAVLRPLYGVLDVLLNNSRLNLFNLVAVQGSDGYTSFIVPVLEAFGCYNIKTQYDYRQDIAKTYDALLLDILNPIMDKVEDVFNAPIEILADILPNLSLFFANNGLLQVLDNLLTPVSALLDALKPIVNVNALLDVLGVNINSLLAKIGINAGVKVNVYDLKATLLPLIGSENVVKLLNGILGSVKIGGSTLGIVLPEIDWLQLASHGELVKIPSQAATYGVRYYVQADQDETLIALLRFLINTVNYQDNYDAIVNLVGGLLGGASDTISDVVSQVLGMLKGDADTVIESLVDLLQSLAG